MKKITLLLLITRGRLGECRSLLFYYFGNYEFPRIRYLGKCRSLWTQHLLSSPLLSSLLIKILVCPPVRLLLRHHFIIKRPPKSAKNSPKRGFIFFSLQYSLSLLIFPMMLTDSSFSLSLSS